MSKAPKRARSTLREPDHAGRRAATAGWIMGALAAVAVAGASFTLLPAPSPRLASVDRMGVDPVTTGSIDPALRRVDPAELSQLRGELRALREEVAAMRAGAQSLSRRLAVLEAGGDPQLPGVVPDSGSIPMAQAMPPEAVEVPGGSVVVDVRPMETSEVAPRVVGPGAGEEIAGTETPDPMTTGSIRPQAGVPVSTTLPFAIDIGTAGSLEDLDRLWSTLQTEHRILLGDLEPRILLRQTESGALDLRLVAGPFADPAAAAMRCAQLLGHGLATCFPAIHDGQRLPGI